MSQTKGSCGKVLGLLGRPISCNTTDLKLQLDQSPWLFQLVRGISNFPSNFTWVAAHFPELAWVRLDNLSQTDNLPRMGNLFLIDNLPRLDTLPLIDNLPLIACPL